MLPMGWVFIYSRLPSYARMPRFSFKLGHPNRTKIKLGGTSTSFPLQIFLLSEETKLLLSSKTWETHINPMVWDQGISGQAKTAIPVVINLKESSQFPNQKQFPLKAKQGLQSTISKFLQLKLFVSTNSPCNTPILPIKKKDGLTILYRT